MATGTNRMIIKINVNQLLFALTLFHNLQPINWFATANVHDKTLSRTV